MKHTDFFCTLFDSSYGARGLTMLKSLERHSDSHTYVLCMDDLIHRSLKSLALKHVTLITLQEFESPELLGVKPTRSFGEYCWTSTPHLIRYCLNTFELPAVTYIDADLFFFSSPRPLIQEFEQAGASILLTEHRFSPKYKNEAAGTYCVQFMTFKNDERGRKALNWWCDRCTEWCYNRVEDGKFGDQKYLDDWLTRFEGVHVLKHSGGGVAPWNVQQFFLVPHNDGKLYVNDSPLVFYHFHNFKLLDYRRADLCRTFYKLTADVIKWIYEPYVVEVSNSLRELKSIEDSNYDLYHETFKGQMFRLARLIKGNYYVMEV